MAWETVIGLEIHTQLATQSKIFSAASTAYGAAANTQACAIDLGMPGVLPVLNKDRSTHRPPVDRRISRHQSHPMATDISIAPRIRFNGS
jgi:hypothetical protein